MTDGDHLVPGTRLKQFEIDRVLGVGKHGITYLARDLHLDVWRAVKEYQYLPRRGGTRRQDGMVGPRTDRDSKDYWWGLEKFLEEAQLLARLDHSRSIVYVSGFFEARGTAYMVMEYVEGRTLLEEVNAVGPLPEARVRDVLGALTYGLSAVHAAGLLHLNIAVRNVIVRPDGTPVLIDFDAARWRLADDDPEEHLPGFFALEQYEKQGSLGPWTDIYALGVMAYWMLTERAPQTATRRLHWMLSRRAPETARLQEDPLQSLTAVGAGAGEWGVVGGRGRCLGSGQAQSTAEPGRVAGHDGSREGWAYSFSG